VKGHVVSIALIPGSFDPVTNGHLDIVDRTARKFDEVLVAVASNPRKAPALFALDERVAMLEETTAHLDRVVVDSFSGLLVEYAERIGANAIVKGLRAVSDFEYEIQMAQMNRRLSGVETFFMPTAPTWSYLSSSLVREVASLGGDVSSLVPAPVAERLRERVAAGGRA
jgi:pantetheine-phosphate adenylyltransferase